MVIISTHNNAWLDRVSTWYRMIGLNMYRSQCSIDMGVWAYAHHTSHKVPWHGSLLLISISHLLVYLWGCHYLLASRSSTVLKKIAVPKRHLDTFGGMEYNVTGRRGVILHTDRYQVGCKCCCLDSGICWVDCHNATSQSFVYCQFVSELLLAPSSG